MMKFPRLFPAIHLNYLFKHFVLIFATVHAATSLAQEGKLLPEKIGDFKIIVWSVYSGSVFTQAEKDANYRKLVALTDIIRKNPALNPPRGFNMNARLYSRDFDYSRRGYGIPCDMELEFCYFFIDRNGKEAFVQIEPPHWDIEIIRLRPFGVQSLGYTTPKPVGEETKPGFNYAAWQQVGDKLTDLIMPGKKETIAPGMDRYAEERVVIYNPAQPPYWLPVTVREAYTLLMDFWKLHWDQVQSDMMSQFLENEWAQIAEGDRDKILDGTPIAGMMSINPEAPVMRVNLDYWNKKLPRSAVQFVSFSYLDDKNFYGLSYIKSFLETLDIKTLIPVIDK